MTKVACPFILNPLDDEAALIRELHLHRESFFLSFFHIHMHIYLSGTIFKWYTVKNCCKIYSGLLAILVASKTVHLQKFCKSIITIVL